MKTKELQQKSQQQLQKILTEKRERLRQLSFDLAQAKLRDTSQIGKTKKDIARILMMLKGTKA